MKKIVVNVCHGGFGLSDEGIKYYAKLKGITLYPESNSRYPGLGPTYWLMPKDERPEILTDEAFHQAPLEARRKSNAAYSASQLYDKDLERDDPHLIQTVEDLGDKANGRFGKLEVTEIPDDVDWQIGEYDGTEWVEEKHRTW